MWNISSCFNIWGMALLDMTFDEKKRRVESVADCIRGLGYTVKCQNILETNEYIISSIKKDIFYYGTNYYSGDHNNSFRYLNGDRTLYEKAHIQTQHFEDFERHLNAAKRKRHIQSYLTEYYQTDLTKHIMDEKMLFMIENGAKCNRFKLEKMEDYENGASTIGNTLPNDIVYALSEYTNECPLFLKDNPYEFYIPDNMIEESMACPAPEESNI